MPACSVPVFTTSLHKTSQCPKEIYHFWMLKAMINKDVNNKHCHKIDLIDLELFIINVLLPINKAKLTLKCENQQTSITSKTETIFNIEFNHNPNILNKQVNLCDEEI